MEKKYKSTDKDLRIPKGSGRTAALYLRVSTAEQVDNFSFKTQEESCTKYIESVLQAKVVAVFYEEGESAKTADRTQLRNLLYFTTVNKGILDYVVVYKIDRWSRSQSDFYATKAILIKNGVTLLSATEQIEDTPTGRFLEGLFAGVAQLDNENKGLRIRDCMKTKALDGWYPNHAPYGYINDSVTRTLVADPEYFAPIQNVLMMFINGSSIPKLSHHLNQEGIRTRGGPVRVKRKFTPRDLWKILDNSMFYAGFYDWGENKGIHGKHVPMITWEQHLAIQDRLHYKSAPTEKSEKFILNFNVKKKLGFLRCSECGQRMRSCDAKGNGGIYSLYYCKNPLCSVEKKSVHKEEIEQTIEKELELLVPEKRLVDMMREVVLEEWNKQHEVKEQKKKLAQDLLNKLEYDKTETIGMRRRKELSLEDYEKEMERIRQEVAVQQLVIHEDEIDLSELEVILEQGSLLLKNIKPLYKSFGTNHKRQLLQLIFPDGVSYGKGKVQTIERSELFTIFEQPRGNKNNSLDRGGLEPSTPRM